MQKWKFVQILIVEYLKWVINLPITLIPSFLIF